MGFFLLFRLVQQSSDNTQESRRNLCAEQGQYWKTFILELGLYWKLEVVSSMLKLNTVKPVNSRTSQICALFYVT